MPYLPVIVVISLATAVIIAVFLWRVKPTSTADTAALTRRVSEEAQKASAIQAKLEASQDALREAAASAAAAKAVAVAADARANTADRRSEQLKSELDVLQKKHNEVEPLVATATANREAADREKVEAVKRYTDLTERYNFLQANQNLTLERATKSEQDLASARAEATALHERVLASEVRYDGVASDLNGLHTDCANLKTLVAEANTQLKATEAAKTGLEQRFVTLTQKHEALQSDYNTVIEQASASKTEVEHLRMQVGDMSLTLEALQANLTEERAKLNQALAKQQSDEAATRQFEAISQSILKETLEEAKRGIGDLAAGLQKSSGTELEKHADKVARTLEPLQNKLQAYNEAIESMKKGSQDAYTGLTWQINELQKAERSLHDQAKALTLALSDTPKMRGNYGELALQRLVEHVGMREKCHFEKQAGRDTEEGRKIPDMVVSLPGGQKVVIDAKAVVNACAEAYEASDEVQRRVLLKKHCDNVRARVSELSSKNYFADHTDAVESVVLFLPAENLYITAMENDPSLSDYAAANKIIICGPSLLIMLLRVANQLWRRSAIEEEAQKIKECGDGIYKSACDFVEKFAKLGVKIRQLEDQYNDAAGTLDSRLIPKGREMSKLTAMANDRTMEDAPRLREDIREWRSSEAKKQLVAPTEKLPGLVVGDETAEFSFATGEAQ